MKRKTQKVKKTLSATKKKKGLIQRKNNKRRKGERSHKREIGETRIGVGGIEEVTRNSRNKGKDATKDRKTELRIWVTEGSPDRRIGSFGHPPPTAREKPKTKK